MITDCGHLTTEQWAALWIQAVTFDFRTDPNLVISDDEMEGK